MTKIQIVGLANDANHAILKIQKLLQDNTIEKKLELQGLSAEAKSFCQALTNRHDVKITTKDNHIYIQGFKEPVKQFQIDLFTYLAKNQGNSEAVTFPAEWEVQTGNMEKTVLGKKSPEFKRVKILMRKTLPKAKISQIERIQNQWLWEYYSFEKKKLLAKNQGFTNSSVEVELFHGTSLTDPRKIYSGEVGFDMRFGAQGMWGRGIYFAVNASYSNNGYAFKTDAQEKQLFLAKVLIGQPYLCANDPSLVLPPINPNAHSKVGFAEERYDSVTGETANSKIFVLYENKKAYPSYLITYIS